MRVPPTPSPGVVPTTNTSLSRKPSAPDALPACPSMVKPLRVVSSWLISKMRPLPPPETTAWRGPLTVTPARLVTASWR
jgi:hypothetical protein